MARNLRIYFDGRNGKIDTETWNPLFLEYDPRRKWLIRKLFSIIPESLLKNKTYAECLFNFQIFNRVLTPTSVTARLGAPRRQHSQVSRVVLYFITTNESASARNTVVAFYMGVFWGIIYNSVEKAAVKVYRLVNELILIGYSIA